MSTAIKTCSINAKNQLVINKNVTVDGTWSLTTDHELCLTLDATQDTQFGDKIILSGRFNDVSPNILSFEARLTQELIKDVAEFSTAIQTTGSESRATWGVNLKF